ncbi:hypothetical protein QGM71_02520 [Virgibacillus sp. C22-A2]|uniref:Uncharacterized protein n=1 Tax=Virgibacillus tibetensis TaxID=3042313 RepID=A0ABU6KC12_9BACI|nr:hypothetical protein [Virgibacillus sp. C22-A2]
MIQDHYLTEDYDQVAAHLDIMHKSLMGILNSATTGDFTHTDDYQIQMQKSLKVMMALNFKKQKRDEFETLNNGVYARRGWR